MTVFRILSNRLKVRLVYLCVVLFLSETTQSQELPYGKPKYFELDINEDIQELEIIVPSVISPNIFENIEPIKYQSKDYYFLKINLKNNGQVHFEFVKNHIKNKMDIFFINLNTNGWVGPYSNKVIKNNSSHTSGGLNTQNILIEISVPSGTNISCPIGKIIKSGTRPQNFNEIMDKTRKNKILQEKKIIKKDKTNNNIESDPRSFQRDHLRNILLCGYWPPSNEGVRPFSTNETLNPDGWIGDNWEDRGYDIHSYFPIFDPPDCENCGMGSGDLEVDYQDTSEDWWNIVDSIQPIAIITFSRGGIDFRWELEWMTTNWIESEWIEDFEEPLYPTPSPPDSTWPGDTPRYSSLPMDSIEYAMTLSGLNVFPVIDYTYGTGNYLSEYLGYHGVWYKAQMDSLDDLSKACYLAGHIHVGGLIPPQEAHEAVKISLREVIKEIDKSVPMIGDVNQDGLLTILDVYFLLSYFMGEINFDNNNLIIADVNYDSQVDIFDLLFLADMLNNS